MRIFPKPIAAAAAAATLIAFAATAGTSAMANRSRGVWFWGTTTAPGGGDSQYGAVHIVGNAAKEAQTVAFLKARGFKRLFGSYGSDPKNDPGKIAAWNERLHLGGIQSQLLIAGAAEVDPAQRPGLITKITERLIEFNNAAGRTVPEKFDALHLDLEPQQLGAWNAGSAADKRAFLLQLRDTYAEIRAHLDANGLAGTPIFADIPFTWDKLPADGGSIGWLDAADRDAWFADIAAPLAGLSIMTFSKDNFADLDEATAYERSVAGAVARVAIKADIGTGAVWANIADFHDIMQTLEANLGFSRAVDVENYALYREALDATPITGVPVALSAAPAELAFPCEPGFTYVVLHSKDLCLWAEAQRFRAQEHGMMKLPVKIRGERRGFWGVYRFPEATGR
ncbi:MAG: hypothetical protein R3F11_26660 [Verrucomicrobiales bacterium]